eukprot:Clim_evm30s230 gene=Clim_evmTU30s230
MVHLLRNLEPTSLSDDDNVPVSLSEQQLGPIAFFGVGVVSLVVVLGWGFSLMVRVLRQKRASNRSTGVGIGEDSEHAPLLPPNGNTIHPTSIGTQGNSTDGSDKTIWHRRHRLYYTSAYLLTIEAIVSMAWYIMYLSEDKSPTDPLAFTAVIFAGSTILTIPVEYIEWFKYLGRVHRSSQEGNEGRTVTFDNVVASSFRAIGCLSVVVLMLARWYDYGNDGGVSCWFLIAVGLLCLVEALLAILRYSVREWEYEIDPDVSPERYASVISLLYFTWVNPMLEVGLQKSLDIEDVPDLRTRDQSERVHEDYLATYGKEPPSGWFQLAWRTLAVRGRFFALQNSMSLIASTVTFAQPFFLYQIVHFVENYDSGSRGPLWLALLFVFGLFFGKIFETWADGTSYFAGRRVGMAVHSVLVAELYRKALKVDLNATLLKSAAEEDAQLIAQARAERERQMEEADNPWLTPRSGRSSRSHSMSSVGEGEEIPNATARLLPDQQTAASPGNTESKEKNGDQAGATVGEIANLMSVDARKVQELSCYLPYLWTTPVQVCICMTGLYKVLGWPAFVGVALMVVLSPLQMLISMIYSHFQTLLMKRKDERMSVMNEILEGIRIIKLFAWEEDFIEKIEEVRRREVSSVASYMYTSAFSEVIWFGIPSMVSLVTFLTYALCSQEPLTATKAFTALTLFNTLGFPLNVLPAMINEVVMSRVSLNRIVAFLNRAEVQGVPKVQAKASSWPDSNDGTTPGRVIVRNVDFHWHDQDGATTNPPSAVPAGDAMHTILQQAHAPSAPASPARRRGAESFRIRNVTLDFPAGSFTTVIGLTGSGKSSLLQGILGEMPRDNVNSNSKLLIYGSVAYVSQQATILNATIRDNICFGYPWDEKRYYRVLVAACLVNDIASFEGGDLTEIGEKGVTLSGGQKQRVSLARALYSDADVYILDDCLSALDASVGASIMRRTILEFLANKTRIVVTHQTGLAVPASDRVIVMEDGRVAYQGPTGSLPQAFKEKLVQAHGGDAHKKSKHVAETPSEETETPVDTESEVSISGKEAREREYFEAQLVVNASQFSRAVGEEERARGTIAYETYATYLSAAGGAPYLLALIPLFVLAQGAQALQSMWLRYWIDAMSREKNADDDGLHIGSKDWYLTMYIIISVMAMLLLLGRSLITAVGSVNASVSMHTALLRRIMSAPISFFDSTPLGRLINRFGNDIAEIDQMVFPAITTFFQCCLQLITVVGIVAMGVPLFLVAFIFIAIWLVDIGRTYLRSSRELKRLDAISKSPTYALFTETLQGGPTVRCYDGAAERFNSENYRRLDVNHKAFHFLWASNRWLACRLQHVGATVSLTAGLLAVYSVGSLSPALVGLSLSYALQFTDAVLWIIRFQAMVEMEMNSVERVVEYSTVDVENAEPSKVALPPKWPQAGAIEIRDLWIGYKPVSDSRSSNGDDKKQRVPKDAEQRLREGGTVPGGNSGPSTTAAYALKGITLTIPAACKVGVVGRTGAGKSTMAMSLFRLVEPARGTFLIDGIDCLEVSLKDLRRGIAIIPQDPTLFSGTVRSNLDPFGEHDDTSLWQALRKVHMGDVIAQYSQALNADVASGGSNFSLGQRQLLCMARALLHRSRILIMDEATASVDSHTDGLIQHSIRREFKHCTIICIAHRLRTVADYDRILVLEKGEVSEYGHPSVLLEAGERVIEGIDIETQQRRKRENSEHQPYLTVGEGDEEPSVSTETFRTARGPQSASSGPQSSQTTSVNPAAAVATSDIRSSHSLPDVTVVDDSQYTGAYYRLCRETGEYEILVKMSQGMSTLRRSVKRDMVDSGGHLGYAPSFHQSPSTPAIEEASYMELSEYSVPQITGDVLFK